MALHALISETIEEVDILATRHLIEGVQVDQKFVKDIGPNSITYRAQGSVLVTLQWGPSSDRAELGESFPFHCDIELPLDDPWNLSLAKTIYTVDTSEWYADT